jgi:hypothetical protein
MQDHNTLGSEGLAHLDRFGSDLTNMLTPKTTSCKLKHKDGEINLVEGITFAVFDDIELAEKGLDVSGRVCTFNVNVPFAQDGDDCYDVEHVDSVMSFMEAMTEHYDVFVINSLSTLVSSDQAKATLDKASYKGVLTNMVKVHQSLIKIKKPCVITNHIMNGEGYLGDLIKRYARDTVYL